MKNMRRHYLIDKPFQLRYAAYVALTLFVVCAAAFVGLYYGIWGAVIESFSENHLYDEIRTAARLQDYEHSREPMPSQANGYSLRLFKEIDLLSARQREILEDILKRAHRKLISRAFFLILLIGAGSIYLTHQIAGPLYRFRKSFDSVKEGNLTTRIYLRKHDEGMATAGAFNAMMRSLDESVARVKKLLRESGPGELPVKLEQELSKLKTTQS